MATTGLDKSIKIAFGFVHGLLLAMAFPIMYMIVPDFTKSHPLLSLLVVIPIISYIWGFGLNIFSQYISCGGVQPNQILLTSLLGPAFVLGFSLLTYFISGLRSPVESILPEKTDANMKYALGFSFYLLWAGIYAQNMSSGMSQSCAAV